MFLFAVLAVRFPSRLLCLWSGSPSRSVRSGPLSRPLCCGPVRLPFLMSGPARLCSLWGLVWSPALVFAVWFASPSPSLWSGSSLRSGECSSSLPPPQYLRSGSSLRSTGFCLSLLPIPSVCGPACLCDPQGPVRLPPLSSVCGPARLCGPRGPVRLSPSQVVAVRLVFAVRGVLFVSPPLKCLRSGSSLRSVGSYSSLPLSSVCGPARLCGLRGPVRLSPPPPEYLLRSGSTLLSAGSCLSLSTLQAFAARLVFAVRGVRFVPPPSAPVFAVWLVFAVRGVQIVPRPSCYQPNSSLVLLRQENFFSSGCSRPLWRGVLPLVCP